MSERPAGFETWRHSFAAVGASAAHAVRLESMGFDGLFLADSQMLRDEVYVVLAECAGATTRLRLGPGITNLVTRHPSGAHHAVLNLQDLQLVDAGHRLTRC